MMRLNAGISMLAAAWLAGCAAYSGSGLQPGAATEADVTAQMGRPAAAFENADGTRRLAYPKGPLGTQTYMVDVGRDGRLVKISQVLDDEVFFHIRPGLTRDQVLRMIGPPSDRMRFSLTGHDAWDYRFVDTWGYVAIFSVTFDGDVVVSKISQRIERDKGMR